MLSLYRLLTGAAAPLLAALLSRRRRRGKEDAARLAERRGIASLPRPPGLLVWIHGASVGEAQSILPLAERLLAERPGLELLITTGTVSSARLLAGRLAAPAFAGRARHQFVPVDRAAWVERFLDHWRPDLALWVESEFWPNLLAAARRRGIPLALINGRISDRSFRRWRLLPGIIRPMLASFALCLGQTPADAERLRQLGAPAAQCLGNLKYAAPPLPAEPDALARLKQALGARPLWVAASTHKGEEAMLAAAHQALAAQRPGLLTVIAPRHPERGPAVAAMLAARGLKAARRAEGELPAPDTAIYIADTLGELGLFYRLAEVVFVGGSLVPHGGQNPLEPARLGTALLFGPHMENFREIAASLTAAGAAEMVKDVPTLTAAVDRLLKDAPERARRARAAAAAAAERAGVLEHVLAALAPHLPPAPSGVAAHARA